MSENFFLKKYSLFLFLLFCAKVSHYIHTQEEEREKKFQRKKKNKRTTRKEGSQKTQLPIEMHSVTMC